MPAIRQHAGHILDQAYHSTSKHGRCVESPPPPFFFLVCLFVGGGANFIYFLYNYK